MPKSKNIFIKNSRTSQGVQSKSNLNRNHEMMTHDKPCLKRPPERNHQFPLDKLLSERKFTASSSIISFSASTSSVVAPRIRRDLPVTQTPTHAKPQKLGTQKNRMPNIEQVAILLLYLSDLWKFLMLKGKNMETEFLPKLRCR